MSNKNINCFNCEYFYITWDPKAKNGCRAIGFKSQIMPSLAVLKNTGIPCQMFKRKKRKKDVQH